VSLEFPKVGSGAPGFKHNDVPTGGVLPTTHFEIVQTHFEPDRFDNEPGVSLYACSTDETKKAFPYDWEIALTIELTGPDDPLPDDSEETFLRALAERRGLTAGETELAHALLEAERAGVDTDALERQADAELDAEDEAEEYAVEHGLDPEAEIAQVQAEFAAMAEHYGDEEDAAATAEAGTEPEGGTVGDMGAGAEDAQAEAELDSVAQQAAEVRFRSRCIRCMCRAD
jgi:hypothetical protein